MANYQMTNVAQTATTGTSGTTAPVAGTVETWTVVSSAAFPAASSGTNQFTINDTAAGFKTEVILVTNVSGTTWTVTRGAESAAGAATPIAHLPGATFQIVASAAFLNGLVGATGTKNQVLRANSSAVAQFVTERINVLDYGAVADNGVTDNLAAFNSAATDAVAAGLELYIPAATSGYGVSADWQPGTGVRVNGGGAYAFKTPGTTVPSAGGFYGTVIMPSSAATFTNAVVVLNGNNSGLKDIAVVGNVQGWTAGAGANAHNSPRAIQVTGRGCRLTRVLGWGGLACSIDVGDGTGNNVAQDTDLLQCVANNNLNPPNVITVAGCSWTNTSGTITTSGNFTTSGITVGMTLSPGFNGLPLGCVVTSVGTTTLTISANTFTANAGPVTLEFIGGIGIRIAASTDVMLTKCRTSSSPLVVGGGNTDTANCHWSAGSTTTNWFPVYCQTTGGFKSGSDVFDCATNVAGLVRRDRGIVQITGGRWQNLNNTGTALPAMKDNEPSGVSTPGGWHIEGGTFTVGTASSPDGFSYLIDFTGSSGNPALSSVGGLISIDTGAMQHAPTIYNGGTPGIAGRVMIGTNPLLDIGGQPEPWLPVDNALLAANMDWATAGATKTMAVGVIYLMKVLIRTNMTWTNTLFAVQTVGAGASTGTFAGLYNSSGTLLSTSSDWGASATSLGVKTVALTTPQNLTAGTFVWVALVCNLATTQASLAASGIGVSGSNVNLANSVLRFAVNGSGVALPGSITVASNTGTGSFAFAVGAT